MMSDSLGLFVSSSLRLATPLVLAATGEVVSEKAGVLNLSLEGMMLTAAFFGALGAHGTGSPLLGLGAGLAAALVLGVVQAVLSVRVGAQDPELAPVGFAVAGRVDADRTAVGAER